jgi:hypothetical protein
LSQIAADQYQVKGPVLGMGGFKHLPEVKFGIDAQQGVARFRQDMQVGNLQDFQHGKVRINGMVTGKYNIALLLRALASSMMAKIRIPPGFM